MLTALLIAAVLATPASPNAACKPTPPDSLGPFYVPNASLRSKTGTGHVLRGVVRSARGCASIARAKIEFWHAGPRGVYGPRWRATTFSARNGTYRFESISPPGYGGRPPHIHIRVSARGFTTLVTQYYPAEGATRGRFDLVLVPRA